MTFLISLILLSDFIRDECCLINTLGKANTFYPINLRQELNNLYIKEHGPPPQGCTWESHQKWSPALPVLATVIQHMDESFHDFYRSRKHYVHDAEEDIKLLLKRHAERHIHKPTPDSTTGKEKEKRLRDCFAMGRVKIEDKKYLDAVTRERIEYFSNLSVLEISERENISLEEAIQMKRREGATGTRVKRKAGSHMDELGEENDEDRLYGYDLQSPAKLSHMIDALD
ncbi:hypothetical protein RSOLAG22IIIB_09487 [Rhizoctonia solani]|uniref:DUF6589 domain-containing protein n=1 Tax=Rhizoctonia solani TaxID=456999 RepID=A0A0K6FYW7_9AGAM|nr:hypothetical protein RSOLAG22IIIB_09487 [Rhizoctonia solani]